MGICSKEMHKAILVNWRGREKTLCFVFNSNLEISSFLNLENQGFISLMAFNYFKIQEECLKKSI